MPVADPTAFDRDFQHPARLAVRVAPTSIGCGTGILTCCPSATPFGLALGPTNPGRTILPAGNLGLSVTQILTAFSLLMPAWSLVQSGTVGYPSACIYCTTLSYRPVQMYRTRGFGFRLSPDHLRRGITRPVSCYALFKWWLPLSQHPGCLGNSTSFDHTSSELGTLTGGLGCFPFDHGACPPRSDSCDTSRRYSEFDNSLCLGKGLQIISALPLTDITQG